MWAMRKVEVQHIPVAVGALGVIPKGLRKSLQDISKRVRPGHVQTPTALLGTARILGGFLEI